jgi:hypothetical protein
VNSYGIFTEVPFATNTHHFSCSHFDVGAHIVTERSRVTDVALLSLARSRLVAPALDTGKNHPDQSSPSVSSLGRYLPAMFLGNSLHYA